MNSKFFSLLIVVTFFIAFPVSAQVELKTGTIYGNVLDGQKTPLAGVLVHLESELTAPQTAATGSSGSFRFTNLDPGMYSALFSLKGLAQVKQENIRVSIGSQVSLTIVMTPSLTEELTVIGEIPLLDARKTGNFEVYNREYLEGVPTAHDPWSIIDETPGIDTDRYQVTQQGVQSVFTARGAYGGTWSYDGINVSDPVALGFSAGYYDFEAFEEIQINTTGGISINLVTKRGGNRWTGNASYFYSGEGLQGSNTPEELVAEGLEDKSNRLDQISEYGFDIGGPLIHDRLFVWGAYRKYNNDVFTITNELDATELENFNFKANFNLASGHESQFNYFFPVKNKSGRGWDVANQAPETLWEQGKSDTLFPGILAGQHTWTPSDRAIITARYSYLPLGFQFNPTGGMDVPMILLAAIPHWEDTGYVVDPIDRPTHDVSVDVNYFKEDWAGGDHEFKFGFNYRTTNFHTFSSYGNGVLLIDYYQTVPQAPLIAGYAYAQHYIDGRSEYDYLNFLFNDTFRSDRLTLSFGLTFSRSTGKNLPSSVPAVPGFESFVGPIDYPGGDPGIVFNTLSPQVGATYDLTGDGKTLIRGNFGRYYGAWNPSLSTFSNPTYVYNGAVFGYVNSNGDRTITPDEIITAPYYYGGLGPGGFDLDAFLATRLYDQDLHPGWADEFIVGIERELVRDLSLAVTYSHRDYRDEIVDLPFGVSADDYVLEGTFEASTELGDFSVPYYVLGYFHDGTRILTNLEGYNQSYDGMDIVVRKRMSNHFMFNGSLTLQRQRANYEGGNSQGKNAHGPVSGGGAFPPFDPTSTPFLDGLPYTSISNLYSEWQLKLNGVYQLPWDFTAGASLKYRQGYPFVLAGAVRDSTLSAFTGTSRHLILVEPYGSRRYDNLFMLDLQFEKSFAMGGYGRLALLANIFNVTNANTIVDRNNAILSGNFNRIEEHLAPRILRLGVRYSF